MEGLLRKTSGDWYDIRKAANSAREISEIFAFSRARLQAMTVDLRMAVEQGINEYKDHVLSDLYSFLDSYRYDSKGFETLDDRSAAVSDVLYCTLLQRLVAVGAIEVQNPMRSERHPEASPGVKEIMQNVQERIRANPTIRQNQNVKNILMQMSIYRRELEQMRQLEPKILPDRKGAFLANFKKKFADVTAKIQEHYQLIVKDDERAAARDYEEINPLKRYDLKPLGKLFMDQAAEFSSIRSTLLYAESEGFKTREILSGIVERRDRLSLLLRMEHTKYAEVLGKGTDASVLAKAFSHELIKILARQMARSPEERQADS